MASDPLRPEPSDETWTLSDSDYRTVVIVRRGADVLIVGGTAEPFALRFDGDRRDVFVRCLAEAGRRAEAPASGMNKVERLARDIIGIPDGL